MNELRPATSSAVELAQQIASEVAEFAEPHRTAEPEKAAVEEGRLLPADDVLVDYDRRIFDEDLRIATRSRFISKHYADAIEAGVKVLNETVRQRTGRTEDGDDLMRIVFSPNGALLRINDLRSKSDQSAQRGHMLLCQGVVGAWRNPRAHSLTDDSPSRTTMMLELIDDLLRTTKEAVRTRKRRNP